MAVDTDYALAMSDGIVSKAPQDTTEPTDMNALTTPWVDLGGINTDGLSESMKETRQTFKRWGSINIYKSVITDEAKTFHVTFLESNPAVMGLYYRLTADPTPDATSHIVKFADDTTGTRVVNAMVFDLTEGTNHIRYWCPRVEVTDKDDVVNKTDGERAYGVTLTAYPDDTGVAISRQFLLDAIVNA